MEAIEEIPIIKKKGRRKKIVDSSEILIYNIDNSIPSNNTDILTTVYKKKTKGAKIIDTLLPLNMNTVKNNNIILLLKCSIKDVDEYMKQNLWNYDNLNYNPNLPNEIIAYEQTKSANTFADWEEPVINTNDDDQNLNNNATNKNIICSKCNATDNITDINNDSFNENEYQKIKQLKILFYKNDLQDKKSDCFWCTYAYDNDPCYILQYGLKNDIYGHGSFCSPECAVAYLFGKQMNLDDSAKTESYQLINYYYGKPNQYEQSIKPAVSPYYFLEKYYGTLTIQEYRKLTKSQYMMLVVEKPVTRILPEIHEDNDNVLKTNYSNGGKYKVKKQSEKNIGTNRNSILREKFGLTSS
jgi:hypothetical protein